jgi:hypothetical protein
MRTKTLLIAAAALAVGIGSSLAQTYSANIVGYYNVTVPANKFGLIAIQLTDASGSYQINSQLTNGVANNSALLVWNGSSFDSYAYFAGFGWYDQAFNLATNSVPSGTSALIQNGDTVNPMTFTVVGTVPTNVTTHIPAGFGFYSMGSPVATNIDSTLAAFPCQNNDVYYAWNSASQTYSTNYAYFAGFGWYDQSFVLSYPTPPVGQGFLYQNNGSVTNWHYVFMPQ